MPLSDFNPEIVRVEFPVFRRAPGVVHFDNAATSQKPKRVLDAISQVLTEECANPGRGAYAWSGRAAEKLERARRQVAEFINAGNPDEVVFTSGGTASLNTAALSWGWPISRTATKSCSVPTITAPACGLGSTSSSCSKNTALAYGSCRFNCTRKATIP